MIGQIDTKWQFFAEPFGALTTWRRRHCGPCRMITKPNFGKTSWSIGQTVVIEKQTGKFLHFLQRDHAEFISPLLCRIAMDWGIFFFLKHGFWMILITVLVYLRWVQPLWFWLPCFGGAWGGASSSSERAWSSTGGGGTLPAMVGTWSGHRTPDNFAAAVGRRCCTESHDVHDVAMQDGGELENQLLSALERWESAAAFTDAISNYIYDSVMYNMQYIKLHHRRPKTVGGKVLWATGQTHEIAAAGITIMSAISADHVTFIVFRLR